MISASINSYQVVFILHKRIGSTLAYWTKAYIMKQGTQVDTWHVAWDAYKLYRTAAARWWFIAELCRLSMSTVQWPTAVTVNRWQTGFNQICPEHWAVYSEVSAFYFLAPVFKNIEILIYLLSFVVRVFYLLFSYCFLFWSTFTYSLVIIPKKVILMVMAKSLNSPHFLS